MENTVTVVPDIRELSPILPDKLGHTTVLKSDDARIVVLTFPAGQAMKDHAAPKTILLQALDGHLRVTAGGEVTDLVPGGIMRIEKLVRHEVEAVEESRLMLTLVG